MAEDKPNGGDTQTGELQETEQGEPGGEDILKLLAEQEEELKHAQDRVLRMAAELDNTRKRLEREKSEGISYANEAILREMVPVLDNLERAIEHGDKEDTDCQGLLEGIRITHKSFLDVLAKFGYSPFESIGQPFDPNRHEAVTQEQSSEYPDMTVIREFQKGYTLRDRLLRPAMVVVARNIKGE